LSELRDKLGDAQLAASVMHELAKDRRMDLIRAERFGGSSNGGAGNGDGPSEKQLAYLQDLGVAVPSNCTRQQASQLIDEAVAR
jgi:hypothetical protein